MIIKLSLLTKITFLLYFTIVGLGSNENYKTVNDFDIFFGEANNVNPFRKKGQPEEIKTLNVRITVKGHRTIRQIVSIEVFNGKEWELARFDHRIRAGWVTIRYQRGIYFLNSNTYT